MDADQETCAFSGAMTASSSGRNTVGIAVGVVVGVILLGCLLLLVLHLRGRKKHDSADLEPADEFASEMPPLSRGSHMYSVGPGTVGHQPTLRRTESGQRVLNLALGGGRGERAPPPPPDGPPPPLDDVLGPCACRPIGLNDFHVAVEEGMANDATVFAAEFNKGEQGLSFTMVAASQPWQREKNRYQDVLPYDHTRVKVRAQVPGW